MALNIEKAVTAMRQMTVGELRAMYVEVFGEQPRSRHKIQLIKKIAWRMQSDAEGDLSERARRRATELANDADLRITAPAVETDGPLPMDGADITRMYKGRKIVVRIKESGFQYDGETYKSLSAIAKVVTGSHWSGHRFFGLPQTGGAQ